MERYLITRRWWTEILLFIFFGLVNYSLKGIFDPTSAMETAVIIYIGKYIYVKNKEKKNEEAENKGDDDFKI